MKTALLFTICLFITASGMAQTTNAPQGEKVVQFPDKEAQYPGGIAAMQKFLIENLVFEDSVENIDQVGRIYCAFVVNEDGTLSNIRVLKCPVPEIERKVIGWIQRMPNWIPAELDGKPVAMNINLPINIHFD